jgi:hypothetical protein
MPVTTAAFTTAGRNLLASTLISNASAQVAYVAIGAGAGALSAGLTSGTPYTSLPVVALPAGLASGQSLVIINGSNVDTVTLASAALAGATSLSIASWTPSYSYPAGSGLVNTPSANDTQLQSESLRDVVSGAVTGAGAGETLVSGYFDPASTPSGTYLEVGYFAGASASATPGSGVLVARCVVWWAHTVNVDSETFQLDSTV